MLRIYVHLVVRLQITTNYTLSLTLPASEKTITRVKVWFVLLFMLGVCRNNSHEYCLKESTKHLDGPLVADCSITHQRRWRDDWQLSLLQSNQVSVWVGIQLSTPPTYHFCTDNVTSSIAVLVSRIFWLYFVAVGHLFYLDWLSGGGAAPSVYIKGSC